MDNLWNLNLSPFKDHKIILGCSGGVDSMVLLHLLHSASYDITVVHVNYQKRGDASDQDMKLVQTTCARLNIECRTAYYSNHGISSNFQADARAFRTALFKEEKEKYAKAVIALAHHKDDVIETFFMNLYRKSGIVGLASIPFHVNETVRPLLNYSKTEILEFAQKNDVKWREDASNKNTVYMRNLWRNKLLPELVEQIPTLNDSVCLMVSLFQEKQQELYQQAKSIKLKIERNKTLNISEFLQMDEHLKYELCRQLNQSNKELDRLIELASLSVGKKVELRAPYDMVYNQAPNFHFTTVKKDPVPNLSIQKCIEQPEIFNLDTLYIHKDTIVGNLHLRKWKSGDRINPIGMKGSQLVSDIIKDAKVPAYKKEDILVVEDDQSLLWVVGLKVSQRIKNASESTLYKVTLQL